MSEILVLVLAIISSVGASQGISIKHCFGSQSSLSEHEPGCDEGQQGTLMFHIDDITSFRTTLSSTSNPPLLVVCESDEPIQMRLNLPYIVGYKTPKNLRGYLQLSFYAPPDIKAWSEMGSFLRYTSETNVSYIRWIKFDSLKHFSGIVRCESTSRSTTWSQLFIAPSTSPTFFHLTNPLNLFVPEIATSNSSIVVPCIGANSSDTGTQSLKLYKRSLYHTFYTNEMKRDCISSLCDFMDFTHVPGLRPLREILGNPPMGDHCREYVKNANWDIEDCNLDAIISCVDAVAVFPKLKENCDSKNGHFKEGVAFTHLVIDYESSRDKRKVQVVDNAVYNESLGFVVSDASWDYESEYLCSMDPKNLTEKAGIVQNFIPLDPRKELSVTLEIIGNELSCEIDQFPLRHILRKRQTQFWMLDCNSLADCDLQFRPRKGLGRPTVESKREENNLVVNVDADHASSIDSKLSFRLPLEFQNGLVGCTGIFITNGTAPFYARTFRYLFNGLDKRPHFVDEDLPSNSLIQLAAENVDELGTQMFSCRYSAFQFHRTSIFIVEHSDSPMKFESNDLNKAKNNSASLSPEILNKASNMWERTLTIELDSGEYQVRCSVPRLDAEKWEQADILIRVPEASGVGVIVWICLAVFLFIFLVILAVYLMIKNRRAQTIIRTLAPEEIDIFLTGGMKDFDAATESSPSSFDVDKIGFPTELQISSSSLRTFKSSVLGEGEFGKCVRGEWKNMAVAVKIPKSSADLDYFRGFLREIKIMGYVGDHRNIVKLHGAVVDDLKNGQCFAVLELSPCGNLLHLLRDYSAESGHLKDLHTNAGPSSLPSVITPTHMTNFSWQIAAGMEYLSEKKVIHGDLAARNVLMYPDSTLKITDFGLSRKLYNYSMYSKKSSTILPWRWMAFESLKHFNFSLLSDVWAFGVTMWEIYTLGQTPFGGLNWNDEFLRELEEGRRPPKPVHADEKVYGLMLDCWELMPAYRPSILQVKTFLQDVIAETGEKADQQDTQVSLD